MKFPLRLWQTACPLLTSNVLMQGVQSSALLLDAEMKRFILVWLWTATLKPFQCLAAPILTMLYYLVKKLMDISSHLHILISKDFLSMCKRKSHVYEADANCPFEDFIDNLSLANHRGIAVLWPSKTHSREGRTGYSRKAFWFFCRAFPLPSHPSDRACLQSANKTHQVPDGTTEDDQQNATPSICFRNRNKVRQALGWEKNGLYMVASSKFQKRFLARSGFCSSLLFPVSSSDCLMRHRINYLESQYYFFLVRKVVWKKKSLDQY